MEKIVVITGATSGIGYALAVKLVTQGNHVIGIGKNAEKCRQAELALAGIKNDATVKYFLADLSTQADIHSLSDDIMQYLASNKYGCLDGLVNNAGTVPEREVLTKDGIDQQWAVNYFSGFLLSHLLFDLLSQSPMGRIVNVTSDSHYRTILNFRDIPTFRRYNPLFAYKRTKLAQVMFTKSFNEKYSHSNIKAFAADPGLVRTEIGFKNSSQVIKMIWKIRRRNGISPMEAAQGIKFLLLEPEIQESSEIYWQHGKVKRPNLIVNDQKRRDHLWDLSLRICKLKE